jgi:hypothetical protein
VATLAVTAVVGTIGVSAYRTYLVRSQIGYSVELAGPRTPQSRGKRCR